MITWPLVQWYVYRLVRIPKLLESAEGRRVCREIGEEIHARWGIKGMERVGEYYRDNYDSFLFPEIQRIWNGIGDWGWPDPPLTDTAEEE